MRAHARRSKRLRDVQRHLGLALGGEPAARLARRLSLPASADTFLRLVRSAKPPEPGNPRVIGIDEWAWRRGRRFGTMIVDLERNDVVDLLPDRRPATLAAWLRGHQGIEIIARDRAEVFAEGIRMGASSARQVVDRWHLLCNLSGAFQAIVVFHHGALRDIAQRMRDEHRAAASAEAAACRAPTSQERRRAARHAPRQRLHAEMTRLLSAGASVMAVSRALGLDRKTVRRWARRSGPPLWMKPRRPTVLDPWRAFLEQRWQEGCRNAAALARELERRGAGVSPRVVREWAMRRRREGADLLDADPGRPTKAWRLPSSRRTAWLLQADPDAVAPRDRRFGEALRRELPELSAASDLVGRLTRILRKQSNEPFDVWCHAAATSPLAPFVTMLRRDLDAVQAAIDTPWSTSPVEGQISRLKMLKRTMYGRAGFDLLRQRVLAPG